MLLPFICKDIEMCYLVLVEKVELVLSFDDLVFLPADTF